MVYADNAEPKSIREVRSEGVQIEPCDKSVTVWEQIKWIKVRRLVIVGESPNLKAEIKSYQRRKDRLTGAWMDEPAPKQDAHALDGGRYGSFTRWGEPPRIASAW